jgi:hypothetical protein
MQQNWFHEFWSNIQLDMNFQSFNQFKQLWKNEIDLFKPHGQPWPGPALAA